MYTGPHIIKDGLVFGYNTGYGIADNDTATRFYAGEPAVNLWDSLLSTQSLRSHTKHYWNGKKWTEDATYTHPGVGGPKDIYLGLVFKHVSGALNSTWSGNSYGYMLRDIACTNGATMTMSSWIYASTDCDVDAIPAVIEGESGGESTVTGYPSSYDLNNKGTWQVTAKKATSDGNTRFIPLYPRKGGVTNGSFTGFFMWALPQVTYGDRVVTPIQPGATRSSTASLIDLKETANIDLSNVSFDSTGQPIWDGTNDRSDVTSHSAIEIVDNVSIEYVYKRLSTDPVLDVIANKYHSTGWELFCTTTNKFSLAGRNGDGTYYSTGGSGQAMVNNKFYHLVAQKEGTSWRLYVNGELDSSTTANSVGTWSNTGVLQIGGEGNGYFPNMELPVFKIYNKVLSTSEIKSNFNAYKNRFDI